MRKVLPFLILLLTAGPSYAQRKTENLVIITMDGMRWQEVFGGIDTAILGIERFRDDSSGMMQQFWSGSVQERRRKLMPFLWETIAKQGQVYGNRRKGSYANVTNPFWFSYPGYNEIFTGYPDTLVNSNDKVPNPNINVLEYINSQPAWRNKVAAFTSWDVFPYILNKWRSGIMVNADADTLKFDQPMLQLVNDMQFLTAEPIGLRPDVFTYFAAREYLKAYQPKVLFIGFDETDDYAHRGSYDQYLKSAHAQDAMIADLWKLLQSKPAYNNKTTLVITVDHGRGDLVKEQWTSHGSDIAGAGEIWMAVIGPDTPSLGELDNGQVYQRQLATTFAALLGLQFEPLHPVMHPIETMFRK